MTLAETLLTEEVNHTSRQFDLLAEEAKHHGSIHERTSVPMGSPDEVDKALEFLN
ncbi:MAG: hypothetical protein ACI841_000015 [Planctomycetota bacterium]|jgi:hypothetical protein